MKKRLFTILTLAVLLLSLVCSIALADALYATVTSSNGNPVRLRTGPGKQYTAVAKYPVGTVATVLQRGTSWSQIQIGSTTGWMMNEFLSFGSNGSSSGTTQTQYNAYVYSDNGLRVWLRASAGGTKLALIAPGTPCTVLSADTSWTKIAVNGYTGYMMTKFIRYEEVEVVTYALTSVSVDVLNPQSGDIITASVLPVNATASYAWTLKKNGVTTKISTEESLTVLDSYRGGILTVTATGTDNYTGSVSFSTNAVVEDSWLTAVELSDNAPYVDEELSAILTPSTANVTYSWRSNGVEVGTEATYTVQESDIGKLIQVKAVGQGVNQGVASATATSVVSNVKTLQYVTLSNEYPVVGETLTVTPYPSGMDIVYVWTVDGNIVSHTNSLTLTAEHLGSAIQVQATALEPYSGTARATTARVSAALLTDVELSTTAPIVGDTIKAYLTPTNATANYTWYHDGVMISGANSASLYISSDYAGETISVVATGTGVYGGEVKASSTETAVTSPKIVSVKIDNANPVVGTRLTAELVFYPEVTDTSKYMELLENTTFLWKVGSATQTSENGYTYVTTAADAGYPVQVRVVNGPDGALYNISSAYTNAVSQNQAITGVIIYNATTDEDASVYAPAIGHTLYAYADPVYAHNDGCVDYLWYLGTELVATGNSYVIEAKAYDQALTVVALAKLPYYGQAVKATSKVIYLVPLNLNFQITQPESGSHPANYTSAAIYNIDGSVYANVPAYITWGFWDGSTFTPAALDEYGAFLPGTKYDAMLMLQLPAGFSTNDGILCVNGTQIPASNIFGETLIYTGFASTKGNVAVSELYITEIPAPESGNIALASFATEQYAAEITWTKGVSGGIFENVNDYECTIKLTPYQGYTLDGVPDNAFMVSCADTTFYSASSQLIKATFHIDRVLHVETDTATIAIDGTKDRLVLCSATLDGVDDPEVSWNLLGDVTQSGTYITSDGLLTVDKNETVGKDLTIVATTTFCGETYTATAQVTIESGSVSDGIKVVFKKVQKSLVLSGVSQSIQFEAYAINSDEGVEYSLLPENVTSTDTVMDRTSGVLTIAADETADYLTVMARSKEDGSAFAKWEITIVHEDVQIQKQILLGYQWTNKIITDVPNGTAASAIESMLPSSVELNVLNPDETESTMNASIIWNLESYEPGDENAKDYIFTGSVKLPSTVENPNNVNLNVSIEVDVMKKGDVQEFMGIVAPTAIKVAHGTELSDLPLPNTVQIKVSKNGGDAELRNVSVNWVRVPVGSSYMPDDPSEQVFYLNGSIKLPSGIQNSGSYSLETTIQVKALAKGVTPDLDAVDWSGVTDIKVAYGTNLSDLTNILPSSVTIQVVTGSETESMDAKIQWNYSGYEDMTTDEQYVSATATLVLPTGVTNYDNVGPLSKTITVTIEASPADLVFGDVVGYFYDAQGNEVYQQIGSAGCFSYESTKYVIQLINNGRSDATDVELVLPTGFTGSFSGTIPAGTTATATVYADASKLDSGTYPIKVTYNGGSTSTIATYVSLNVIPEMKVSISVEPYYMVLQGVEVKLTANVSGNYGDVAYLWEYGETTQSITYTVNSDATVWVKVTDLLTGQTASASILLKVYPYDLVATVTCSATTVKIGDTVTLSLNASGGTGVYNYIWAGGETTKTVSFTVTEAMVVDGKVKVPVYAAVADGIEYFTITKDVAFTLTVTE